jgi:hypothetical protein
VAQRRDASDVTRRTVVAQVSGDGSRPCGMGGLDGADCPPTLQLRRLSRTHVASVGSQSGEGAVIPRSRTGVLSIVLGLVVQLVSAGSISAIHGIPPVNLTVSGPTGTVVCGQTYTFTAMAADNFGTPFGATAVTWSEVNAPDGTSDTISPVDTVTDVNGVATTQITFNGPSGTRSVRAFAPTLTAFAQVLVSVADCEPPPTVHVGSCQAGLGLPPTTFASGLTPVQRRGGYISFRLSFGAEYAGRRITVTEAFRSPPDTTINGRRVLPGEISWSAFSGATTRIADGHGDVIYTFRSSTKQWISVRGSYPGSDAIGPAAASGCQGRWR